MLMLWQLLIDRHTLLWLREPQSTLVTVAHLFFINILKEKSPLFHFFLFAEGSFTWPAQKEGLHFFAIPYIL